MSRQRWTSLDDVVRAALKAATKCGAQMPLLGAHQLVAAFFSEVVARVHAGEKVAVPGFGVFRPAHRKATRVRTPSGEWREVPASRSIHLRASKAVRR